VEVMEGKESKWKRDGRKCESWT